ncbi:MAG: MlaD family protein [Bacteroidota bacterium]
MSNETKIGLFAVIVIAIFIWGYKFLKGQNVFTTSRLFYVEYQQVNQLAASAPVFINGFQVGVVSSMYLKPEDMKTIIVVMNIDRGVAIPKDTKAEIMSTGFVSGPAISLNFTKVCSGDNCAESGDYLQGVTRGTLESLVGQDELDVYLAKLGEGLSSAMDVLNKKISDPSPDNEIGKTLRDLQASVNNLRLTSERLNRLMNSSAGDINGILKNMKSVTGTLDSSNQQIKSIIDNAATISGQLADADIGATIDTANLTLSEAKLAIAELTNTLESAKAMLENTNSLVAKINNGEGTIGKLFTDETLYNKLSETSERVDSFLTDLEDHPYRYIPLKSRRKVKRYDRKDARAKSSN